MIPGFSLPRPPRRARVSALLALAVGLLAFGLAGCLTDRSAANIDYLRSPVNLSMDPVAADHPYCLDASKRMGLSEQACKDASKFRLRWNRPEDTATFKEYRVYLDTTPPGSNLSWSAVRAQRALAAFVLEGLPSATDSVIFILATSGTMPAIVDRATTGLVALDTTGRIDSLGRLVFGVVGGYREGGDGLPGITWVITSDRFAPYPLSPAFTAKATSVTIEWDRPRDPTSFFNPGADSGIIRAYYLRITRGGIRNANRPGGFADVTISYRIGGIDRTAEVTKQTSTAIRGEPVILFRLPDSMRIQNRNANVAVDSIRVILSGFTPQDTVDFNIWSVDTAGNLIANDTLLKLANRIRLTDTTEPTRPNLTLLSTARNTFVYRFSASRDRVPSGSGVVPAENPNANIEKYLVSRRLIAGPLGGALVRDTIIQIPGTRRGDTAFTDTASYLPPGATYRLVIQAVDSSGHYSEADTLVVSTLAVPFPDDSTATCPPGFVAIPGGRFLFGDTAAAAGVDERPGAWRIAPSYCIEALEHRNNAGAFVTGVTWQQAHDACRDLSQSMTSADSTWLCTEAEWERACEGAQPDVPLAYGMQSERRFPGEVRYTCNIGTGDSAMAVNAALRDPSCISYDGVLDMSGNLSEWVLDPYTSAFPGSGDSVLTRGVPHTTPTSASVRGFRGNNYLSPVGVSPATQLARSRCSNRDYATQSRPRPFAGCVSDGNPLVAILYNNTSKPPRCLALPDSISPASVDTMIPARDSSTILVLRRGIAKPYEWKLPVDTNYVAAGLKPLTANLTRQTLAIVTFRNSETSQEIIDTLHAAELLNASAGNQDAVFKREAAAPWSAVKSGGVYQIAYRYAHVQTRNLAAKAYYSNPAMGFRCCSKPRP